ncbi:MAG TPA: tRNA lysidine(34) synthetase TilS, partial [Syntrophobacteraceae bacterium]|nr:tRNA lysidine(34) synthetase TilS [Syntrophobacteraceae bacterium]
VAQLTMLHLDHQLRGEESSQDARFIQDLATQWGLPCHCRSVGVTEYRETHRVSLEMAARECRHRFFMETLADLQANRLALGHQADDQAEEMLLRLIRGTGPGGLAGMAPGTPEGLIRPLLFVTRREILQYADEHGLAYRQGSSNFTPFCQRNALRLEILPLLKDRLQPHLTEVLGRHADLVRDEEEAWREILKGFLSKVVVEQREDSATLEVAAMNRLPVAIRRRLLRHAVEEVRGHLQRMEVVHIEALLRLLEPAVHTRQIHLPDGLRARRSADQLVIQAKDGEPDAPRTPFIISQPGTYRITAFDGSLTCRLLAADELSVDPAAWPRSPVCAWLDADRMNWPLTVRSWQPGDR